MNLINIIKKNKGRKRMGKRMIVFLFTLFMSVMIVTPVSAGGDVDKGKEELANASELLDTYFHSMINKDIETLVNITDDRRFSENEIKDEYTRILHQDPISKYEVKGVNSKKDQIVFTVEIAHESGETYNMPVHVKESHIFIDNFEEDIEVRDLSSLTYDDTFHPTVTRWWNFSQSGAMNGQSYRTNTIMVDSHNMSIESSITISATNTSERARFALYRITMTGDRIITSTRPNYDRTEILSADSSVLGIGDYFYRVTIPNLSSGSFEFSGRYRQYIR